MAANFGGQKEITTNNGTTRLTLFNKKEQVDHVTAAATFYAAKLLEYSIIQKMINTPRGVTEHNIKGHQMYSHNGPTYRSSQPGNYPAVKSGALANLDGQNLGYRAVADNGTEVRSPTQFYKTGSQQMVVGTNLYYEKYLREGTRFMDPRKSMHDLQQEMQGDVETIIEGFAKSLSKDSSKYGRTPNFPDSLKGRFGWLQSYAKKG